MELKTKFALRFAIGFSIGMLVDAIISSVITTNIMNDGTTYFCNPEVTKMFGNEILGYILQFIIAGLHGAICLGGTVVFDIEEWSVLRATATHFIITAVSFTITATILKWWSFDSFIENLIFVGIILLMYVFIWCIQYVSYKVEVKRIEKDMKDFQNKNAK
jgi:positive regulator of sigma E activity